MSKFKVYLHKDNRGNIYYNLKYYKQVEACICIDGKNQDFKGYPKVVIRTGDSKYKNQILLQFLITEKIKEYPSNSVYRTIEYYFTIQDGIEFFTELNKALKDIKDI